MFGLALALAAVASPAWGQESQLDPAELTADQRLKLLVSSVEPYELKLEDASQPLKLHPHPLLRFDNSVGGVVDGVVLMWTDGARPAALAQVFAIKSKLWLHEFQSMADRPLALVDGGRSRWQPKQAGASFRPVPDAPQPEATRASRLTQMKGIARRFAVSEDFRARAGDKDTTKYELRMLAQPAYRYPETNRARDGAIFAFVHGTDPEAMLTLEAQLDGQDGGWKFAWAPLTCWALQARLDDAEVWSAPEMLGKNSATQPYHIWTFQPDASRIEGQPRK
jgi:hypothetical protein